MKSTCETTQLSISDKFDESLSLDHSETIHIESCSECDHFYNFVHGETLQYIASARTRMLSDVETESLVNSVVVKLNDAEAAPVRKGEIMRLCIVSTAVAAIAVVSISQLIKSGSWEEASPVVVGENSTASKKVSLPVLTIPEIKLDEKYSALNRAVANRYEIASYNIKKLKYYHSEGGDLLEQYIRREPEITPESRNTSSWKSAEIC